MVCFKSLRFPAFREHFVKADRSCLWIIKKKVGSVAYIESDFIIFLEIPCTKVV